MSSSLHFALLLVASALLGSAPILNRLHIALHRRAFIARAV
jgi:hypothetical protein